MILREALDAANARTSEALDAFEGIKTKHETTERELRRVEDETERGKMICKYSVDPMATVSI